MVIYKCTAFLEMYIPHIEINNNNCVVTTIEVLVVYFLGHDDVIIKSHNNSGASYINPLEINDPSSPCQQMDYDNEKENTSHEDDNIYQPLVNANRDYLSIYFCTYLPEIRIKEASNSVDELS